MNKPLAFGLAVVALTVVIAVLTRDTDEAEVSFDALNATFEVECMDDVGPVPFVDGEWASDVFDDIGRSSHYAWINDTQVAELVNDSPGPEVAVEIVCNWGGSGSVEEVQVFAGNSGEARRLGQVVSGTLYVPMSGNMFAPLEIRQGRSLPGDPHCCPSAYMVFFYQWDNGSWVEFDAEYWVRTELN